ncbi:hypothetical protein WN943_012883 [Citrus x changshan-huyou]
MSGISNISIGRAGWCVSLAAAGEWSVMGGIGWMGDVDVGGDEFGRRKASTAAAMDAVKVEMSSARLEVSAAAANVGSGN